ncbi:hypothetical protein [Caloranaerobacter azorensis]|uniref:Uncharacterized protein n=1 Tax=Caloranaerobacter azorensis TaxID=116090 RepID=A0A6P1YIP0_9FIRM|nr:hypothetical protein [Caloranaerobacter azorensis]QIB27666.1 hypothetical protein G3A45_10425 [Caloranaerobacter azorensis]
MSIIINLILLCFGLFILTNKFNIIIQINDIIFILISLICFMLASKTYKDLNEILKVYLQKKTIEDVKKFILIIESYIKFSIMAGIIGSIIKLIMLENYYGDYMSYFVMLHRSIIPITYGLLLAYFIFYPIKIYFKKQ